MESRSVGGRGITRRAFVTGASLTGAAWAAQHYALPACAAGLPQGTPAPGAPLVDRGFASARKLVEGVYAVISDTSKGLDTMCNGGFVFGSEAALVWEGYVSPKGAAFQMETLRMVTQVPVRAAIDSHYHFDHSLGNGQYAAAGIPIWAHERVVPLMVERYAAIQNRSKAAFLAAAETHVREAISESDKQHAEADLGTLKFIGGLVDNAVLALPNRSLGPSELPMKIDLGGREVVIETHPGHTPGDLILRIPAADIVFTGDLLFNRSYAASFDADMAGWLKTLDEFGRYGRKTTFVPGHGAVCGQEGIDLLKSVFADLAEHARQMVRMGVPVQEAQARYAVPERFKGLALFSWGLCIAPAVAQFYQAAKEGKI